MNDGSAAVSYRPEDQEAAVRPVWANMPGTATQPRLLPLGLIDYGDCTIWSESR